jgi:hypothetical protein
MNHFFFRSSSLQRVLLLVLFNEAFHSLLNKRLHTYFETFLSNSSAGFPAISIQADNGIIT